jgi:hypothetical protein
MTDRIIQLLDLRTARLPVPAVNPPLPMDVWSTAMRARCVICASR